MAPKNPGLFAFLRRLPGALPLALAFCLALSALVPAQPAHAYGGGYGDEYYSGGNLYHDDLGGYGYYGSGDSSLMHASAGGGVGIDLGCGSLNIFDYMKSAFNVSDIATQLKSAMQTMLAKMLLTYMMSIPQIAAAYDTLNALLDARFSMFQQSCNLDEIRAKAKQTVVDDCIKQNGPASTVQCQEMADPVKSFMNNSLATLSKNMGNFNRDPIGNMQGMFCDPKYDSESAKQNPACLFMSFAPRFCLDTTVGGGCTGPSQRPPVSMAGAAYAFSSYNQVTVARGQSLAARWRSANPDLMPADYDAVAAKAAAMANEAEEGDDTLGQAVVSGNKLALTDVSYVSSVYGDGGSTSSEQVLKEYQDLYLTGCSKPNRDDPLRMTKFIAKAINAEQSRMGKPTIDANIDVPDNQKVDATKFFDIPQGANAEALKSAGVDPKTAAKMIEQTYSCEVNGQLRTGGDVHATSPLVWAAMANAQGDMWGVVGRGLGKNISCDGVNRLLSFWIKKIEDAKVKMAAAETLALPKRSVDANTTVGGTELKTDAVQDTAQKALDNVKLFFESQRDANAKSCVKLRSVVELMKPADSIFAQ